jgi:hypothetical protein
VGAALGNGNFFDWCFAGLARVTPLSVNSQKIDEISLRALCVDVIADCCSLVLNRLTKNGLYCSGELVTLGNGDAT